jgi:putative sigma-54 modulation protein
MNIQYYGENEKFSQAMKIYFEEKIQKVKQKLKHEEEINLHVHLRVHKLYDKVEVTFRPHHHEPIHLEERAPDAYKAIDALIPKLERQIRKIKTKEHKNYYK